MHTFITVVAVVLAVHIVGKLLVFLLPYARRRAALDRSYGSKPSATSTQDAVTVVACLVFAVLLFIAGVAPASFLIGLWVGATLIQLYFHRFTVPLTADVAPPPVVSPIKTMSYAIQAAPWRPWPEIGVLVTVVVTALWILAF